MGFSGSGFFEVAGSRTPESRRCLASGCANWCTRKETLLAHVPIAFATSSLIPVLASLSPSLPGSGSVFQDHFHNVVTIRSIQFECFRCFSQRDTMTDDTINVHLPSLHELKGPRVGMLHPPAETECQALSSCHRMRHGKLIVAGDADQSNPAAVASHL